MTGIGFLQEVYCDRTLLGLRSVFVVVNAQWFGQGDVNWYSEEWKRLLSKK